MRLQPRRSGTTLVEMMVVVVIAAILLSMAAPSFHGLISSMRLRSVAELFVAHLNFARSEAIKRNARVVLCKSTDGKQCAATGRWDQGWIVFHDANDNAQTDVDEPVLLQQPALHASPATRMLPNTCPIRRTVAPIWFLEAFRPEPSPCARSRMCLWGQRKFLSAGLVRPGWPKPAWTAAYNPSGSPHLPAF